MTVAPMELVIAITWYALLACICAFWMFEQWATARVRVGDVWSSAREDAKDFVADVLTWCRTLTFRKFVLHLGFASIALGQRLMDWAQRPETPSAAKLSVHIHRQWERRDVVVTREHNVVRVQFGGRTLPIKV